MGIYSRFLASEASTTVNDVEAPVLLCGLGRVGRRVFEFLVATDLPVVVLDSRCNPNDPRLAKAKVIRGDFRDAEMLQLAGVQEARCVFLVTSDDLQNISAALAIRRLNPTVRIVIRMFNQNLLSRLGRAVENIEARSVSALTAPLLALTALTGEVLGTFHIDGVRHQVANIPLGSSSPLIGRTIEQVSRDFQVHPVAHKCSEGTQRRLHDVRFEEVLHAGDQLLVYGTPTALARVMPMGERADWEDVLPATGVFSIVRRFFRMAWRFVAEVDWLLKACAMLLLIVILASTSIHANFGLADSYSDGLYRTISIIATGADMHAEDYEGWQKIFVSILRVFGTVLTASFTAIFTNYLLRARLGGVLEVRRIPDGGHVLVCGLGNVGFRVVEELIRCGEPVVVIEKHQDNPFIHTCRNLGAAVVVGDGTVAEVLKQANAGAARSIVAATSNDLANLEIALLVRELNPKQRVVVRLTDTELADTLRSAANIRLALSIPELAAPAFVAALYGDRVQALFRTEGQTIAVLELSVQPRDPRLHQQRIADVTELFGFLPLALRKANQSIGAVEPDYHLQEGDTLLVLSMMSSLEQLFRGSRI